MYAGGYESTDDAQVDGHLNVVSSRIGGTTAAVYVSDNQTVEAGQPLVDLDPSEQKVAYAQAKAQYDQAVAQLKAQRPSVAITQADNAAVCDHRRCAGRTGEGGVCRSIAGSGGRVGEAGGSRGASRAR